MVVSDSQPAPLSVTPLLDLPLHWYFPIIWKKKMWMLLSPIVDSRSFVYSRCRKVLIIMSPKFLDEPECDFQIKFAHALSPGEFLLSSLPCLHLYVFLQFTSPLFQCLFE